MFKACPVLDESAFRKLSNSTSLYSSQGNSVATHRHFSKFHQHSTYTTHPILLNPFEKPTTPFRFPYLKISSRRHRSNPLQISFFYLGKGKRYRASTEDGLPLFRETTPTGFFKPLLSAKMYESKI